MKKRIIIKLNNLIIVLSIMLAIILLVSDINEITIELVLVKIVSMIYIGIIWDNNKEIIMKGVVDDGRRNRGNDR